MSLQSSLEKLHTDTLIKIADKLNIPGNYFRQGTWDRCIFNQIADEKGFSACAKILNEDVHDVMEVISNWDAFTKISTKHANRLLRRQVMEILLKRGALAENTSTAKSRVVSVNRIVEFESTMIPEFDYLPLISDSEISDFLQSLVSQ